MRRDSTASALVDPLLPGQLEQARQLLRRQPALTDAELLTAVQAGTLDELWEQFCADRSLPPELLGQAYEALLGQRVQREESQLTLRADRQRRKTAGAFYTPDYIVQYIVQQTLGAWLDGKSIEQAAALRVLDPACGCGQFLVAVYRYLCDWFLARHVQISAAGQIEYDAAGHAHLTAHARRSILARHVYGVELDPLAAETARRTLLLAADIRALDAPERQSLARNIRAGNALDDVHFAWAREFPQAFSAPESGFQAIVGNPPYRRELAYKTQLDALAATRLGRAFRTPRMDLWYYFLHLAIEQLLPPQGLLSFITSSYWTSGRGAHKLIAQLRAETWLEEIFDLDDLPVFPGVEGRHLLFLLRKEQRSAPTRIKRVPIGGVRSAEAYVCGPAAPLMFEKSAEQLFRGAGLDLWPPADAWLAKLRAHPPLRELGSVRQGIAENPATVNAKTLRRFGGNWRLGEGVFSLTAEEVARLALPPDEQPLLRGYHDLCDLGRYRLAANPSRTLIYSTRQTCPDLARYPALAAHLQRFRTIMEARRETRLGKIAWWHLHWPRDERIWQASKIVALQMAARPSFVPAERPVYVPFSANVFVPSANTREHLYYLTALLNSRTLWKWQLHHAKRRGVHLELNGHALGQTPLRRIDFAAAHDRARHDRLVGLVGRMLTGLGVDQTADHETEIDAIVAELYGLTADQRALVEAETAALQRG